VISEKPKYEALLSQFDQAVVAYRAQDWSAAAAQFRQFLGAHPDDGPAQIFLERTTEFLENAPEADWDGVYVMKTK